MVILFKVRELSVFSPNEKAEFDEGAHTKQSNWAIKLN
jgi:hypothetical protein